MPELPEVETVKKTLKRQIVNRTILNVDVLYNLIEYPSVDEFKDKIKKQTIVDVSRRGKWLMFELNDYYLLSHLRMEGKYFIKQDEPILKHEHIIFYLDSGDTLRYHDTRKFGKMHLIPKKEIFNRKPLNELGLEPWDKNLTISYLKKKYSTKSTPIKTVLLDQSIITGIGNIYADEILFLSSINPYTPCKALDDNACGQIIINTRDVLKKAIEKGGTTIRSYESSKGVHGRFQHDLLVHNKEGKNCPNCNTIIIKTKINGRGTYYCPNCQNKNICSVSKKNQKSKKVKNRFF